MLSTQSILSQAPTTAAIEQAVQALVPYMVQALSRLVAAASLSGAETPAAVVAEDLMDELGLHSERIAMRSEALAHLALYSPPCCADEGRYNLLAIHAGQAGRSVLFNGHLDVVPTGCETLWRHPPYMPTLEEDWLYGRGAGDMKGGIVCALTAFKALQTLGVQPAGCVGFNWVLEEECTGNGTLASVAALRTAIAQSQLSEFDAVLIPEPLGEHFISAQVGVFWMRITLTGKPSHAAYMGQGVDPIAAAITVIQALRELETEWNQPQNRHPAYREHAHPINFNIGRIEGGEWTSSLPCQCSLDVRIGLYPGMDVDAGKKRVAEQVQTTITKLNAGIRADISYAGFHAPGCEFDLEQPAIQTLANAFQHVYGAPPAQCATTATTDARHFRFMLNKPVTCYGPLARDIHGIDEAVSLSSMVRVATTFALFLRDWCGVIPLHTGCSAVDSLTACPTQEFSL